MKNFKNIPAKTPLPLFALLVLELPVLTLQKLLLLL